MASKKLSGEVWLLSDVWMRHVLWFVTISNDPLVVFKNILRLSVGATFVYRPLPNSFRSPKIFSSRCGCVRCIEPSGLRSMFTPEEL